MQEEQYCSGMRRRGSQALRVRVASSGSSRLVLGFHGALCGGRVRVASSGRISSLAPHGGSINAGWSRFLLPCVN
jgi:hypothetical protein